MAFLDTLKGTVNTAFGTITDLAHTFIEKNRTNAKLNRLRSVMKSESELMNRAYIALGKGYYEQLKKGEKPQTEREEKLLQLIDTCKARIARARDCYRKIVESQNEFLFVTSSADADENSFEQQDVVDITVACSNENEYASSPFAEKAEAAGAIADETPDDEAPVDELF